MIQKSLKLSICEISFYLYSFFPSTPQSALRLQWWLDDNGWGVPQDLKTVMNGDKGTQGVSFLTSSFFLLNGFRITSNNRGGLRVVGESSFIGSRGRLFSSSQAT